MAVGVVAALALVLSILAFLQVRSGKQGYDDMQKQIADATAVVGQLQDDMSRVKAQAQNDYSELKQDIAAIKDAGTKKPAVAQAVAGVTADAAPAGPGTYHTMKAGESYAKIAKQYGTNADAIEKLNPGVNPAKIKVGQKIRVK